MAREEQVTARCTGPACRAAEFARFVWRGGLCWHCAHVKDGPPHEFEREYISPKTLDTAD